MAIIKCKMCGGDLNLIEDASTATCEYCGSVQTVPKVDDDKKLTLFARANRLRAACEFDKAAGIYESIVADFPEEAEAYWGLVLCKYGIEYVDDPATGRKIPTCHRSSFDSILDDSDFEQAMENADMTAQRVYRNEAKEFERIRKGILEVSSTEKPYDIFICYKETAETGDRTLDSVLAQDLYTALTDKGYRVFFSRITLQGKLGEAYEPYIFAALNSAKVMLAVGTRYEYYNAVWVKNEWSRYLKLCQSDKSKHLIPCYKDLSPEDMPKEFHHLQGADLGRMGAVQDILFNMEKYIPLQEKTTTVIQKETFITNSANPSTESYLKRAFMFLEDKDWDSANEYCEKVLDIDPENAQAYLGKLLAQQRLQKTADLKHCAEPFDSSNHYQKALRFGDAQLQETLTGYITFIKERNETARLEGIYLKATSAMSRYGEGGYRDAAKLFASIGQYKDAAKLAEKCQEEAERLRKHGIYSKATQHMAKNSVEDYRTAEGLFSSISGYLDSAELRSECIRLGELCRLDDVYRKASDAMSRNTEAAYLEAAKLFDTIPQHKDAADKAALCRSQAAVLQQKAADAKKDAILEQARQDMAQNTKADLQAATKLLKSISRWKDADALAAQCQERINALLAAETAAKEKARKQRKVCIIAIGALICLIIAATLLTIKVIIPNDRYNHAVSLMEEGQYAQAIKVFAELDGFRDSVQKIDQCDTAIWNQKYDAAIALMDAGKYEAAIAAFEALNGYRDSAQKIDACKTAFGDLNYDAAMALKEAGSYEDAIKAFEAMEGYRDSAQQIIACQTAILEDKYNTATILVSQKEFDDAIALFTELGDYKDAPQQINATLYAKGENLLAGKHYAAAAQVFDTLGTYQDSQEKLTQAKTGVIRYAAVGQVVEFGCFEQDGNVGNGAEQLQWIVMQKKDNEVVLLNKYILDNTYFDRNESNKWDKSSLKAWLNGDFLNTSFTAAEQTAIKATSAGKVFIPTVAELEAYYGDLSSYQVQAKLITKITAAAGRYHSEEAWWWWTRTAASSGTVKIISDSGHLGGSSTDLVGGGVRPMIVIQLGN